jgi:hypothetical protein
MTPPHRAPQPHPSRAPGSFADIGCYNDQNRRTIGRPYAWLAIAAGGTGIGTGVSLPASNNATLIMVLLIPLVFLVPEHRGTW